MCTYQSVCVTEISNSKMALWFNLNLMEMLGMTKEHHRNIFQVPCFPIILFSLYIYDRLCLAQANYGGLCHTQRQDRPQKLQ